MQVAEAIGLLSNLSANNLTLAYQDYGTLMFQPGQVGVVHSPAGWLLHVSPPDFPATCIVFACGYLHLTAHFDVLHVKSKLWLLPSFCCSPSRIRRC